MRLEKYIINEADTGSTTVLHEVGTAIYTFNPSAKINDKQDFLREINKNNIFPVNSSLSKVPFDSYLLTINDVFSSKDVSTLLDAKSIGTKIRKIFGKPSAIMWTGPTNDASMYGSSDIVVFDKSRKVIPISLKKGKGQLKNMGTNVFSNIIFEGVFDDKNILKLMFSEKYIQNWDTLVKIWLNIIAQEGLDAFGEYDGTSPLDTWNGFQKNDIPSQDVEEVINDFGGKLPSKKIREVAAKFYSKKYGDMPGQGNSDWIDARNRMLDIVLSDIVHTNVDRIRKNLKTLFKVQLSSGQYPLWLVANSGKDIMYIPSNDDLDLFADRLLKFDFTSSLGSAGYIFSLLVKKGEMPLMDINIEIRWKNGQMNGKPATSSRKKMYVNDKQWNDMFNQGRIWENKLVMRIINEWYEHADKELI